MSHPRPGSAGPHGPGRGEGMGHAGGLRLCTADQVGDACHPGG
jgi:hypothetical protein